MPSSARPYISSCAWIPWVRNTGRGLLPRLPRAECPVVRAQGEIIAKEGLSRDWGLLRSGDVPGHRPELAQAMPRFLSRKRGMAWALPADDRDYFLPDLRRPQSLERPSPAMSSLSSDRGTLRSR